MKGGIVEFISRFTISMLLMTAVRYNVDAATISVIDIVTGMEFSNALITDLDCKFSYELKFLLKPQMVDSQRRMVPVQEGEKGQKSIVLCRLAQKDIKVLLEREYIDGVGKVINRDKIVYDGEAPRSYEERSNGGQIGNEWKGFPGSVLEPRDFYKSSGIRDIKLTDFLREPNTKLIGTENIDNHLCYLIEHDQGPESIKFRVWVDPARGFRWLRKELYVDGMLAKRFDSIELKEFAEGIYLPIKGIKHEFHAFSEPDQSKEVAITTMIVDINSVKINSGLPDSLFTIEFPLGSKIYDHNLGTTYISGGDIK